MQTHLFIHATLAVGNMRGLPSLILEKTGEQPLLAEMIMRLQRSKSVDCIHVVTSDNLCDDPVADLINPMTAWDTAIPIELNRIASNVSYAITESNLFAPSDFLFDERHYGFYAAECLMTYASGHPFDLALICSADDVPLIEPDTIDSIVTVGSKKGIMYGCKERHEINILAVPVAELSAKIAAVAYQRKNRLNEETARIKATVRDLAAAYPSLDATAIEREKTQRMTTLFNRPVHCREILDKIYNGKIYGHICPADQAYEFYPVHSQMQLEKLRAFVQSYESVSIEQYHTVYGTIQSCSTAPALVDIELTNRCDKSCSGCPQTLLTRGKQDMQVDTYHAIIDRFCDLSPLIVLSGCGEPTLHPHIPECISYAKEKQAMRVCLETNGSNLDDAMIGKLIESGLDILVLNADALDAEASGDAVPPSDTVIDRIYTAKKNLGGRRPFVVVQTVNKASAQQAVQYYYDRWEYIADAVSIQPYNDYAGTFGSEEYINLTPHNGDALCAKTGHMLVIHADGNPSVCKQMFDTSVAVEPDGLLAFWQRNHLRGGSFDMCAACTQKYFRDLFVTHHTDKVFGHKLDKKVHRELIEESIGKGDTLFERNEYLKALEVWEPALRVDPGNQRIMDKVAQLHKLAQ